MSRHKWNFHHTTQYLVLDATRDNDDDEDKWPSTATT